MSEINQLETVKKQYDNSNRLNTRISIHQKYSTNKLGFGNWIYSNYKFSPNINVLELGCGTGEMWKGKIDNLPSNSKIYLTDYSEGMVTKAKELLGKKDNVFYNVVNIENIPYDDLCFDRVIANMMLYHVSNIPKALSEVRRVLKDEGYFYCATYGENRIVDCIADMLNLNIEEDKKVFTLQNGYEILKPYFKTVKRLDYNDSLDITNLEDLLDYLYSLDGISAITKIDRQLLKVSLQNKMTDGVLHIPKEYGMFVCKK